MVDNMRIWTAVEKTDPNHTKKVTFGRAFTSIDAHWQIMQATKQFGPIGQGWGYNVEHSTSHLAPEMVLAVADVTIWWREPDADKTAQYGPLRATCEMWSPARDKGKLLFEADGETIKMRVDEDAPKKAMTDALTKGLSHLGFSADVFLGLFDDNRYVQKVAKEFANGNGLIPARDPPPPPQRVGTSAEPRGLQHVDPVDQHLIKGDGRSAYQLKTAEKGPGRLAAELWASTVVNLFKETGFDTMAYRDWLNEPCTNKGTKTHEDKLAELREKHPDLGQKIDDAASNLRVAAA